MTKMQVKFSFDDNLMKQKGIKRKDVYYTLKKNFLQKGLICVSEENELIFEDSGRESDYGNMWFIIMELTKTDWFVDCASSCVFLEDEGEETIISQIPRFKQIMATA